MISPYCVCLPCHRTSRLKFHLLYRFWPLICRLMECINYFIIARPTHLHCGRLGGNLLFVLISGQTILSSSGDAGSSWCRRRSRTLHSLQCSRCVVYLGSFVGHVLVSLVSSLLVSSMRVYHGEDTDTLRFYRGRMHNTSLHIHQLQALNHSHLNIPLVGSMYSDVEYCPVCITLTIIIRYIYISACQAKNQ